MKMITVAIIGCGDRGANVYGRHMHTVFPDRFQLVALCDIRTSVLAKFGEEYGVPAENRFTDEHEFFAKKRADLVVIATQDKDHVRMTLTALALGYDVLVEKPLTASREECEALLAAQHQYGGKVAVCHVLRYAPAFLKMESLLKSGAIGKLIAIEALEQVWYAHQAHSFVRGNWRRADETSPMILAKCCHDFDLLQHYAGSKCKSISSVGDLAWFKPENAPEGATERCLDCPHIDTCPYSAPKFYISRWKRNPNHGWVKTITAFAEPLTEEMIVDVLRTGPYGRCVYHCDNDVVDHEITTMTFENGVKASLTMTGFTGGGGRSLRFHGSLGEIIFDEVDDYIKLKVYGKDTEIWSISEIVAGNTSGHGGGDIALVESLYQMLTSDGEARTSLEASIESHLMAIAAEESRVEGGKLVFVH